MKFEFCCVSFVWKKCVSREGSSITEDWDERAHTVEEVKAMLQLRRDAALNRDNILSHSFSQQVLIKASLLFLFDFRFVLFKAPFVCDLTFDL